MSGQCSSRLSTPLLEGDSGRVVGWRGGEGSPVPELPGTANAGPSRWSEGGGRRPRVLSRLTRAVPCYQPYYGAEQARRPPEAPRSSPPRYHRSTRPPWREAPPRPSAPPHGPAPAGREALPAPRSALCPLLPGLPFPGCHLGLRPRAVVRGSSHGRRCGASAAVSFSSAPYGRGLHHPRPRAQRSGSVRGLPRLRLRAAEPTFFRGRARPCGCVRERA